jgi:hypothetical protein
VGSAFVYLLAPSRRPNTAAKFKRSLACLRWVGAAKFKPLETSGKTA